MDWTIDFIKATPATAEVPQYVTECGLRCTATDGDVSASVYGTCTFKPPSEATGPLTPFDEITEEQVLEWCWDAGIDKDAMESALAKQLQQQKNPASVEQEMPWKSPKARARAERAKAERAAKKPARAAGG